jgi:hypothetical protein
MMKIQVEVLWVVKPCRFAIGYQRFEGPSCLHLHPDKLEVAWSSNTKDGGSKFFRNVGILPQQYTASQPRRPRFERVFANFGNLSRKGRKKGNLKN